MIAIICAMEEELNALLDLMEDVAVTEGPSFMYHEKELNIQYHQGKIKGNDVVALRCGVGIVYATIATVNVIHSYHPDLIINLGVAGSLNKDTHVNDIVVADKVANWRIQVPTWERSLTSIHCSYPCDDKAVRIVNEMKDEHIKTGGIVSADEFIRFKNQTDVIKRYFPDALAGEMEGAAIANTCYAYQVPCSIIRSISDETLVNGNYKEFEFNLNAACKKAAELCKEIIERY